MSGVVIAGVGMMTSVGLSAAETSASVRARLMRMSEITWQDDHFQPFVVAEVPEDGLPGLDAGIAVDSSLTYREARLLRLGVGPLFQAVSCLPPGTPRPGLALSLPEHDTTQPVEPLKFLDRFVQQAGGAFDRTKSSAQWRGRAGGLLAISTAVQLIESGRVPMMLAGGIDSFRDPYVLGLLTAEGRVKTATNLDGFVPGEGAGFLLLAARTTASTLGLQPVASLSTAACGFESGHLYSQDPYRGEGLAATLRKFLLQAESLSFREVYSSMNGENHWAKEWGVSFMRNQAAFDPAAGIHHPADCYGDVGAASGPLMTGLAVLGIQQNFRRSPALVYCSSDRGERAVLAVTGEGG